MLNKLLSLVLTLSLLSSCANYSTVPTRLPASTTDEISYYLSIDKFKYYINEYSIAFEGKAPHEIIAALRKLSVEEIIDMHLDSDLLADANNYDELIFEYLETKGLTKSLSKSDLKWNYNFFRNKLNEAFTLSASKYDIALDLPANGNSLVKDAEVLPEILRPEDMTLDSGHYISNRTTRAIYWEAIKNNRAIEFHLGDSREFLKLLKEQKGEILYEVKPLAKNYNKIFIVKYPGESSYRYAITNIGGKDRLDHLVHQISLSNLNNAELKNKVIVKGDIKKFHEARTEEHALQLKLLPTADRVIIGQKESIDGKFNLFWKVKALKNLYDSNPSLYEGSLDAKTRTKIAELTAGPYENLFKDKKYIEDAFAVFESTFEKNPSLVPGKFKIYNYDNFTIEMCDYVFTGNDNKEVRWRVVSNVWGDEIIPIAQAFKNTGHNNVVYMGTAGAFANKGYKVGDLVVPGEVHDGKKKLPVKSNAMQIDGAKYGGSVEHVGSPFEESNAWLDLAKARSEFVEVETLYLRQIFDGPKDNVEMYLLISDILGSETETLANATSAKRKNAQNKLLAKLFERDAKKAPSPSATALLSPMQKKRDIIFKALEKKSTAYKYFVYSQLKNSKDMTAAEIVEFAEKNASFTDAFLLDRLVKTSEVIHDLHKKFNGNFDVAFTKSLVEGTFNPKTDKIEIVLKAKNSEAEKELKKALEQVFGQVQKLKTFANINVSMSVEDSNIVWMKIPERTDPDFLVKIYALSGLKNAGIYKNVTYNGNLTLDYLPTTKSESPLTAFYQGVGTKVDKNLGESCVEAMKALMLMFR